MIKTIIKAINYIYNNDGAEVAANAVLKLAFIVPKEKRIHVMNAHDCYIKCLDLNNNNYANMALVHLNNI